MIEEKTKKNNIYLFKRVSIKDKYNFYEYLSIMLDSGISLSEALKSSSEKMKNQYFKEKIKELIIFISSGDSFSKSMKKLPQIFFPSEVSMVETGETTGTLVLSFSRMSNDLRMKFELYNKIKAALTYPIIIFSFLTTAILVVLVYVIPSITAVFDTSGTELPTSTKALIATSDFISNNFLSIIFTVILSVFSFMVYKNTKTGKKAIDDFLLSLPLVGNVYKNYIIATISSSLASLSGAGINIIKILGLVGKSTNNATYEEIFNSVIVKVSAGNKIVESMHEVDKTGKYFPADFLQMLSAGEKTASIEEISKKINAQYVKEVNYSLANMTKFIEPIALLIAGIFVLWFAIAILGSIMKVTQTVS